MVVTNWFSQEANCDPGLVRGKFRRGALGTMTWGGGWGGREGSRIGRGEKLAMSNTALREASEDAYKAVQGWGRGPGPDMLTSAGTGPPGKGAVRQLSSGQTLPGRVDGQGPPLATLRAARGPSPWVLKGYLSDVASVNTAGVFMRLLKAAPP